MKNNFLDKFDRYINWIWVGLWLILIFQFSNGTIILEAVLLSLLYVATVFPFTTFLSKNLLEKAMKKKRLLPFIFQFSFITIIIAIFNIFIFILFEYLEKIGLFPPSLLFDGKNSIIHDFAGSLLAALLINFGFCGLRFLAENLKLQKILIDSQLQILQEQVNPHFMFNVLNHVNVLIRKEPDLASSVLVQYTNILRYQLYNGKKEAVSIRQEVDFMIDFIEIEKIRWKNNLDVRCSWDIQNDNITLPPLLFITFVENAFKHVSRSKTEKGYIDINLKQNNRELLLFIENSKYANVSTNEKKEASGIGLKNINQRLEILYPGRYHLYTSDTDKTYSISLSIKL